MALALSEVRLIVQRVCTRPEVLEACRRHGIGLVVETLGKHEAKVTQGQIAALTGIPQGRLSEYMNHKRTPEKAQLRSRSMTILRLECAATLRQGSMSIPSTDCER